MRKKRATLKRDPLAWQRHKAAEAERHRNRMKHRDEAQKAKDRKARSQRYFRKKKSEGTSSRKGKTANVLTHAENEQRQYCVGYRQAMCREKKVLPKDVLGKD